MWSYRPQIDFLTSKPATIFVLAGTAGRATHVRALQGPESSISHLARVRSLRDRHAARDTSCAFDHNCQCRRLPALGVAMRGHAGPNTLRLRERMHASLIDRLLCSVDRFRSSSPSCSSLPPSRPRSEQRFYSHTCARWPRPRALQGIAGHAPRLF